MRSLQVARRSRQLVARRTGELKLVAAFKRVEELEQQVPWLQKELRRLYSMADGT